MLERDVRRAAMALTESRWLLLWCLWRRQLQLIGHRDPRWDYERGEPVQKKSNTIGGMIEEARLAAGLTQAELGVRLGVTQQRVAYLERPSVDPRVTTLEAVAKALKLRLIIEFAPPLPQKKSKP